MQDIKEAFLFRNSTFLLTVLQYSVQNWMLGIRCLLFAGTNPAFPEQNKI